MWPPEALEFLRELEDNNDRDWFKANRARYDEHLVAPARALAASLAHLGEPRFFRPYNDARFGNRPPLKEQLGVAIGYTGAGGWYVELSLDGLLVEPGCTTRHPTSSSASARRSTTGAGQPRSSGRCARRWTRDFRSSSPSSNAPPRGYPQDHPRIDHLRRKHLTVFRRHELEPWLHEPACTEIVGRELDATRPLVAGCASTSVRRRSSSAGADARQDQGVGGDWTPAVPWSADGAQVDHDHSCRRRLRRLRADAAARRARGPVHRGRSAPDGLRAVHRACR